MMPSADTKYLERLRMKGKSEIDQYITDELKGNRFLLTHTNRLEQKNDISIRFWRK